MTSLLSRGTFMGALGVLLLNDHVLKASGWLPGWLTGKLSDFAGLYVAAMLLGVLVQARGRLSRAACCLLVGAGFSAINLWPEAARWYTEWLGVLGVQARVWLDASDLIALPTLGLAYLHLATSPAPTHGPAHLRSVWQGRLLVAASALACIATSEAAGEPQGPVC